MDPTDDEQKTRSMGPKEDLLGAMTDNDRVISSRHSTSPTKSLESGHANALHEPALANADEHLQEAGNSTPSASESSDPWGYLLNELERKKERLSNDERAREAQDCIDHRELEILQTEADNVLTRLTDAKGNLNACRDKLALVALEMTQRAHLRTSLLEIVSGPNPAQVHVDYLNRTDVRLSQLGHLRVALCDDRAAMKHEFRQLARQVGEIMTTYTGVMERMLMRDKTVMDQRKEVSSIDTFYTVATLGIDGFAAIAARPLVRVLGLEHLVFPQDNATCSVGGADSEPEMDMQLDE